MMIFKRIGAFLCAIMLVITVTTSSYQKAEAAALAPAIPYLVQSLIGLALSCGIIIEADRIINSEGNLAYDYDYYDSVAKQLESNFTVIEGGGGGGDPDPDDDKESKWEKLQERLKDGVSINASGVIGSSLGGTYDAFTYKQYVDFGKINGIPNELQWKFYKGFPTPSESNANHAAQIAGYKEILKEHPNAILLSFGTSNYIVRVPKDFSEIRYNANYYPTGELRNFSVYSGDDENINSNAHSYVYMWNNSENKYIQGTSSYLMITNFATSKYNVYMQNDFITFRDSLINNYSEYIHYEIPIPSAPKNYNDFKYEDSVINPDTNMYYRPLDVPSGLRAPTDKELLEYAQALKEAQTIKDKNDIYKNLYDKITNSGLMPNIKPDPYTDPEVTPKPEPEVNPNPDPEVNPNPDPEVTPKPEITPNPDPEVTPNPDPEVTPKPEPGTGEGEGTNPDGGQEPGADTSLILDNFLLPEWITNKFPFSIPFDLIKAIKSLEAKREAPRVVIPIVFERYGVDEELVIDLSIFNDQAVILRKMELLLFSVGLILVSRNLIKS